MQVHELEIVSGLFVALIAPLIPLKTLLDNGFTFIQQVLYKQFAGICLGQAVREAGEESSQNRQFLIPTFATGNDITQFASDRVISYPVDYPRSKAGTRHD